MKNISNPIQSSSKSSFFSKKKIIALFRVLHLLIFFCVCVFEIFLDMDLFEKEKKKKRGGQKKVVTKKTKKTKKKKKKKKTKKKTLLREERL